MEVSTPKPLGIGYTKEPQTIGNHIRNRRLLLKLVQKDVAKILGVDTSTICIWEKTPVMPPYRYFPKIIEFLEYNPLNVDANTIHSKIQLCCALHGLTKGELAKYLGVGVRRFKSWEEGKSEPDQGVKNILDHMLSELILQEA